MQDIQMLWWLVRDIHLKRCDWRKISKCCEKWKEHVTHLKTILVDKGSEIIINESINVPKRSVKGLPLFYEPYVAGARDSEKTFNPDITEVKVIVNGILNKVYSQGMEIRDM